MDTAQHTPVTQLAGGQLLRVADGTDSGVAVFEGLVWITQSGDERDVFLQPGDTFHFDRDGIAIVEALRDARLVVYKAPRRTTWRRIATTVMAAALAVGAGAFLTFQGDSATAAELVAFAGQAVR